MNYATIKNMDIANGPGFRVSLFVSGCTHKCKGCFNPETWDFNYGNKFTEEVERDLLYYCKKPYIKGLSILGGEPLHPENVIDVSRIIYNFKCEFPEKDVWLYSGYTYEYILDYINKSNNGKLAFAYIYILNMVDVLVDGPFIEDLKDLNLRFRGSSNQRLIDSKTSFDKKKVILYDLK